MAEGWGDFYFMIGSSAAGLIGLLFVVVTLTADIERHRAVRGQKLFMTPTVFHFAVVLTICALATAYQGVGVETVSAVTAVVALSGFLYMVQRVVGLMKPGAAAHWTDIIFYGVAPMAGYLALGIAAWSIYFGLPYASLLLAGLMLGFLLLGIRNAWDLVTWIAPRTGREDPREDPANDLPRGPPSPG